MSNSRFIAHFSTSGKVSVVEDWLRRHVGNPWTIRSEGASGDLQTKKYLLEFTQREDYLKFRDRFVKKPAAPRP